MPIITLSPNPVEPTTWVTVNGTGFSRSATRVRVDGVTVGLESFKPNATNSFSVGFQSKATDGTQNVEAQQKKSGKWVTVAAQDLVVKTVVVPPQPKVPGAPTGLKAASGDTTITLSWVAPTDDGGSPITGYSIIGTPGPVTKTTTATTLLWTGLVNDRDYTFVVSAVNAVGPSVTGATITAAPKGTVITPPPGGTYTKRGPLNITSADNSKTFEWLEISNTTDDGNGISINGASNIIISNCKITGFHSNFLLQKSTNIQLIDCWIPLGYYCGFNVFSSNNVKIIRPRVDKIWHDLPNPQADNAYGVKIDILNSGDPVCDTVEVSDGVFKESKLWMNLNAHSGKHISFLRNELHNAPRGIFVTGVEDLKIIGNKVLDPATVPGGSQDVQAIAYGGVKGGLIDQNTIDNRYPSKVKNSLDPYVGPSTGVVIGTNPVV